MNSVPPPIVSTPGGFFPDPDGVIARLAAELGPPAPSVAARVSALLAGAR